MADEQARQQAEQRIAAEAAAKAAAQTYVPQPQRDLMPVHNPAQPATAVAILDQQYPEVRDAAPRADEPATLKLGDINGRLAPLQISAAGLVILGIHPAATQGASKLYRPSDYDRVLRAIAKHVNTLQAVEA